MITRIGMYYPHEYYMSFCSPLLTDGRGEWKLYALIGGVLSFQSVHGAEPPWSVSTSSSATAAGRGWNWSGFDECEVKYIGWNGPNEDEVNKESDADCKQVDVGDQEDTAKIDWKP